MLSHRPVATQQDSSLCIYAATSPDPTRHNHTRKATLTRCERQLFIANICRGRCSRSTGATGQGPTTVNHVLIEEHGCTVSHTACCTQTQRRQVAPLRMPSASEKVAFYPKPELPNASFQDCGTRQPPRRQCCAFSSRAGQPHESTRSRPT